MTIYMKIAVFLQLRPFFMQLKPTQWITVAQSHHTNRDP